MSDVPRWSDRLHRFFRVLSTAGASRLVKSEDDVWQAAFSEVESARAEGRPVDQSKFVDLTKSTGGK